MWQKQVPHLEPLDNTSALGIPGGWCHTLYTICSPDSQVCPQLAKFSYTSIMYTCLKWLSIIFTKEFELTLKLNKIIIYLKMLLNQPDTITAILQIDNTYVQRQ